MTSILQALSQGLRAGGATASQSVYNTQRQEEQTALDRQQRNKELTLGVLVKGVESGSLDPARFQEAVGKLGLELPGMGPSVDAQAQQFKLNQAADLQRRRQEFESNPEGITAPPEDGIPPTVTAERTPLDIYLARAQRASDLGLKDEFERNSKLAELEIKQREKTSGLAQLIAERDKYPEGDPRRSIYDNAIGKETAPPARNAQFVELPTGRTVGGKPEFQTFAVVGVNEDGTPKLAPQGRPAIKSALVDVNTGTMSPENAAKTQLVDGALADLREFRDMVIPDGKVNRTILAGLAAPGMSGIPGTDSRKAYSLIYNAIEAKLRAQSGAAVPELEVVREVARFVPNILDNEKTILSKMDRLEGFLKGTYVRIKDAGESKAGTKPPVYGSAKEIEDAYAAGKIKSQKELIDILEEFYMNNPDAN